MAQTKYKRWKREFQVLKISQKKSRCISERKVKYKKFCPCELPASVMNLIKTKKGLVTLSQQNDLIDLPSNYSMSASIDEGDSHKESIKNFGKQLVPLKEK